MAFSLSSSSSSSSSSEPVLKSSPFEMGDFAVKTFSTVASNREEVYVVSPTAKGKYPVVLFLNGFLQRSNNYSHLLQHIASHGFIIVSPQVWKGLNALMGGQHEVDIAAEITNWLKEGLKTTLPEDVEPNLDNINLVGHSRGGKAAFALALGRTNVSLDLTFSKLLGIDPVAGPRRGSETDPKILAYVPNSFDLAIPVAVIGTGLGSQRNLLLQPCAPEGVNHDEFFNECKAPSFHLVTDDYGHMDMLNDGGITNIVCKQGKGSKDPMRSCVGGIVVAFLSGYGDFETILKRPEVAPVKITVSGVKEEDENNKVVRIASRL